MESMPAALERPVRWMEARRGPLWRVAAWLLRFGWAQAWACAFAVCLFVGLALSSLLPLPLARYDAMLLYAVAVTAVFWWLRLESGREIAAILGFHVVGLVFELFKVHMGSWSYPEPALTKIAGVPLYSGFLYAAVGSYVVRAWKLLDLRLEGYRPWATALVAAAIYVNFLTHHWLPDARVVLAVAVVVVTWGSWVGFRVAERRHRMPLAVSFALIGFFLWVAENVATLLGAWSYPDQLQSWTMVHPAKAGAWALLVTVSFVLVVCWKRPDGTARQAPA
ncbi:DUF817 domain-containing protein [Marinactinospora thermotolerans]|uniref:Uncharacterized membrane protein YoaT, DUF817 family n=1 Tax=Marinactinospora thermotolerans DSM 45154 TaxID=1122192 RepID=A0A1T4NRT8_9ACTN|nr:DUF817 domain-containing protein [Marinactinospora thermotolerans]SJZ81892.1 Uncharacterized membrane protein YoaT, DUF817 family [Marinactinospora thermotolerans DSM 45154]